MIEWFVVGVMTVLLLAQHIFWSKTTSALLNKLMSRDYQSYIESEKYLNQKTARQPTPLMDEGIDPTSERHAQELNAILGMV